MNEVALLLVNVRRQKHAHAHATKSLGERPRKKYVTLKVESSAMQDEAGRRDCVDDGRMETMSSRASGERNERIKCKQCLKAGAQTDRQSSSELRTAQSSTPCHTRPPSP